MQWEASILLLVAAGAALLRFLLSGTPLARALTICWAMAGLEVLPALGAFLKANGLWNNFTIIEVWLSVIVLPAAWTLVVAVHGSMRDLPEATAPSSLSERSRAFLERLPPMVEVRTSAGLALVCHGIGPNDMAKVGPDDAGYALDTNDALQRLMRSGAFRWLINGHSHRSMLRALPGISIINAGTLYRQHSPCFLEVDFRRQAVFRFEFGADGAPLAAPIELKLR